MEKILVIDDEKPTLSMFKLFLDAYGYNVLTAESGQQGIELFKKEKPDIVFTDIKMPGMDGLTVLKKLKKINTDTEVIIITGHGDMEIALKALDYEATDYINKPINRNALDSALKRAGSRIKSKKSIGSYITYRKVKETYVLDITGNITGLAADQFKQITDQLLKIEPDILIINFKENFTINAQGIKNLTHLIFDLKSVCSQITIAGVTENFREIFKLTGVSKGLKTYEHEHEALESIGIV